MLLVYIAVFVLVYNNKLLFTKKDREEYGRCAVHLAC